MARRDSQKRRIRAEARAKAAALRTELRAAIALKRQRMRELTASIRAERAALGERLRAERLQRLAELREWQRSERAKAREHWKQRRADALRDADGDLARVRVQLATERAHAADVARIAREARARAAEMTAHQSDDTVRALVPTELAPLFERMKRSIRGTDKESRAEAFLRLAASRPDDVFAIVEPQIEQMISTTLARLAEAKRVSVTGTLRAKAANGNGLTAGGPAPAEVGRIRALEATPKVPVKGEGLDTTEIAKRVREEIKGAVKSGSLPKAKYSVRTDKYSMGSSITVVASDLPFPVLNPDAFKVERGATWATFDSTNYRSRFTPRAQEVERKLEAIVGAYHWDRSDSMTDYYNERFAKDVRLTENKAEWQRIEAEKVAAARAAEERT